MVRLGKERDDCKVINSSTGEWEFPYLTDGDGLSISGPTGHHSGGETHGCQGFTYMCDGDFSVSPPKFRFRKETYHVQYNDDPQTGEWTSPFATGPVKNNWKGYGWVRYNKKDGISPGKDSVICEAWWNDNPTADIKNWKMMRRTEDKGAGKSNWGVKATCDGNDYQVGTWSNIQFRFKSSASDFSLHPLIPEGEDDPNVHSIGGEDMSFSDSASRGYGKRADMPRDVEMKCLLKWDAGGRGKCHFKNISLREIDPTKAFDDDPDIPPPPSGGGGTTTSTITGTFKFSQDINTIRASQCAGAGTGSGGGGETGSAKFYDMTDTSHTTELSNSSTFQNRTRVGEQCTNSSSPMRANILNQLDVMLSKVGTPSGSPTIRARIWSSSGAVRYLSPTAIDPATLSTSFTLKTFDFSANTVSINTGDVVGVEWTGTSDTDYVLVAYGDKLIENCTYVNYESGAWEPKPTTRDFSCVMWE
jgi:hypothetical protein